MKKYIAFVVALCCILTSIPISSCAYEGYVENNTDEAYAVILDAEGNVIKTLDLEVTVEQVPIARSVAPVYAITYTASENIKTDSDAASKNGVSVTGVITWTDFFGTNNDLNAIDVVWRPGNRTLSNRYVKYGARDIYLNEIDDPFEFYPTGNTFHKEENVVTGYQFYLTATAKINETGNTIAINFNSTVTAT